MTKPRIIQTGQDHILKQVKLTTGSLSFPLSEFLLLLTVFICKDLLSANIHKYLIAQEYFKMLLLYSIFSFSLMFLKLKKISKYSEEASLMMSYRGGREYSLSHHIGIAYSRNDFLLLCFAYCWVIEKLGIPELLLPGGCLKLSHYRCWGVCVSA